METVPTVDIKAERERLNLSQAKFAEVYQLPLTTVQNWEQGRRHPEVAAQLLLRMIEFDPESSKNLLDDTVPVPS